MEIIYGRHMSPGGKKVQTAVEQCIAEGNNAIQVFAGGRIGRAVSFPTTSVHLSSVYMSVHASYVVGISNREREQLDNQYLYQLRDWCQQTGAQSIVLHPGSCQWDTEQDYLSQRLTALLEKWDSDVSLLLENSAGGGQQWAWHPERIAAIIDSVNHPSLGCCLDTTHAWAAGWEPKEMLPQTWKQASVRLVHFNPPAPTVACGSHRDRHGCLAATCWNNDAIKLIADAWLPLVPCISESNPNTVAEPAWLRSRMSHLAKAYQ